MEVASPSKDSDVAMTTDCQDDEGSVKNASNNERTQEEKYTSFKFLMKKQEPVRGAVQRRSHGLTPARMTGQDPLRVTRLPRATAASAPNRCLRVHRRGICLTLQRQIRWTVYTRVWKTTRLSWMERTTCISSLIKTRFVVLQIASAYKASDEILKQYAIGTPRSDDLPPSP